MSNDQGVCLLSYNSSADRAFSHGHSASCAKSQLFLVQLTIPIEAFSDGQHGFFEYVKQRGFVQKKGTALMSTNTKEKSCLTKSPLQLTALTNGF